MNRTLPHILERFVADSHSSVFFKSGETNWNPDQFHRSVCGWAVYLQDLGVKPGDRVALYLRKSLEEAGLTFAIAMAGAIVVNIHPSNRIQQVRHILQDCQAGLLISSKELLRRFGRAFGELNLRHLVVVDDAENLEAPCQVSQLSDADTISAAKEPASPRPLESDVAAILYSSGSTGRAKGIVQTHGNLVEGAEVVSHYVRNSPQDIILSVLPFSFDYGLNQLLSAVFSRFSLVLQDYLFPNDLLTALQEERISGLAGVPTIWIELLGALEKEKQRNLTSLRYITNSGGRLFPESVRRLKTCLPHVDIYLMYGLTEAFRSTFLPPSEIDTRPDSIGKAVPNVAVHVFNQDEHRECKPGEVGELIHRGAFIAKGYWGDPETTARVFRPNPLLPEPMRSTETVVYSGDLVRRDEDGFLFYVGRKDKMLKSAGHRISPDEITEKLLNMEGVQQAAVIGIEDEHLGQQIAAILQLAPGAQITEAECGAFLRRFLPTYMIPSIFRFADRLPKTSNGKLDMSRLHEMIIAK